MIDQLDTMHSLDPLWILRVLYNLFTGGVDGSNSAAAHFFSNTSVFVNNLPYYAINFFARYAVFSIFLSIVFIILIIIYTNRYLLVKKKIIHIITPL